MIALQPFKILSPSWPNNWVFCRWLFYQASHFWVIWYMERPMNFIVTSPLLHFFCSEMNFSLCSHNVYNTVIGSITGRDFWFISKISIFFFKLYGAFYLEGCDFLPHWMNNPWNCLFWVGPRARKGYRSKLQYKLLYLHGLCNPEDPMKLNIIMACGDAIYSPSQAQCNLGFLNQSHALFYV